MDEKGQKFVSLIITIVMVISTLAIVGYTTAEQPDDVPAEDGENGIPDVQVTELRAETPVMYLGQNNRLVLSVSNFGNATALKVTANVTDIIPKQSEELITTLHIGALKPEMERSRFIDWTPTTRGIHYIKVELKCEYLTHNSPAEMVEAPPVILSAGFPVAPKATIELDWGPGGWPVYDDDNTINLLNDPSGIREVSGTLDDPIEISVHGGLTIEESTTLKLNEHVTLVMLQEITWPTPLRSITINSGAKFIIDSPSRSTTIQSSLLAKENTYPFLNSGTVSFTGATIWYTYGPSDTALAGGIQNLPGSTCVIDNCDLLEADTHSLYIDGTADVQVMGEDTVIGRDTSTPNPDVTKGHGIFVNGATPVIRDITVQYHKQDGIHIENSVSEGAVFAPTLEYYSSTSYDYNMPTHPEHFQSMNPIVAVGDAAHAVWIDEGYAEMPGPIPMLYVTTHLMYSRSLDYGATWSEPILHTSGNTGINLPPGLLPDILTSIGIASEGEYVGIVYAKELFHLTVYKLIYSDNNGEDWIGPINISPILECGKGSVCIDWQGDTAYIVFKTDPLLVEPPVEQFEGIAFRTFTDGTPGYVEELFETEGYGIPKITVDGDDIHVVFCAPESPDPDLSDKAIYIHGSVASNIWDPPTTLTTYNVDGVAFSQKAFDLVAESGTVYFAWHNYDVDNYNIWYIKGASPFQSGDWGPPTQLTTDIGNSLNPTCAFDSNMNLHVVWQDDRDVSGNMYLRYSRISDLGVVLPSDVPLTEGAADSVNPSIAIDQADRTYIMWEDGRDGYPEIYMKRAPNLVVSGAKMIDNKEKGISIESSNPIIVGSIIDYAKVGIFSTDSEPTIEGNIISHILKGIHIEGTLDPLTTATIIGNYINCTGDDGYGIYTGSGTTKIEDNEIIFSGYLSYTRGIGVSVGVFPPLTPEIQPLDTESISINNNVITDFDSGLILGGTASSIVLSGNEIISNLGHGITFFKASAPLFDVEANDILGNKGWGIYLQDSTPNNLETLYEDNNCGCNKLGNVICQWSMVINTAVENGLPQPIQSAIQIIEQDNTEVLKTTTENGQIGPVFLTEFHVGVEGQKSIHTPHIIRIKPIYEDKFVPPTETSLIINQPDILYQPIYSPVEEIFDYNLNTGINYISLPLVNDALGTAADLAELIGSENVEYISLWDPFKAQTLTYYPGDPSSNFYLVQGAHYEVSIISPFGASFTLQGCRAGWVDMALASEERNDIGWIGFDNIWASDFASLVPSFNFESIGYYDTGVWHYYDGNPIDDFLMTPGEGYRLYVSRPSRLEYSEGELDLDEGGLTYGEEVFLFGTNHFHPKNDWDTDNDGMDDWWEAEYYNDGTGTLPTVWDANDNLDKDTLTNLIECKLRTNPNYKDTDKDGLLDSEEDGNQNGEVDPEETNPAKYDTDGDGMGDNYEKICKEAGGLWDPAIFDERYAVLFVGGGGIFPPRYTNHVRYWNQLINMYETLIEVYGYDPANVFVLYADGNPPDSSNCHNYYNAIEVEEHRDIIDYSATYTNAQNFFTNVLMNVIDSGNEFLYIWTYDHGGKWNDIGATLGCWDGEISDYEFANWLAPYDFRRIAFTMGQCFSGGFIGDLMSLKYPLGVPPTYRDVIISTSCAFTVSYSKTTKGYLYHHWLAIGPCSGDLGAGNALYAKGRLVPEYSADTDGNNIVSLYEAFIYAEANDDYGPNGSGAASPQYAESIVDLGNVTFL